MLVRQLFDQDSFTYTYLLADEVTREAALIDPVREQLARDVELIRELGLRLKYVLETHVHADHVTSAGALREQLGAETVAGVLGATCASKHVRHGDELRLGAHLVRVLETPGHTDDSLSYAIDGHVFTGDALFIRGTGRTDFQNGSAEALYDSIHDVLFALPGETLVWPGHDYKGRSHSTIAEEKRLNPRLAGKSKAEFTEIMGALGLPPPKRLHEAVPANRACGRAPEGVVAPKEVSR